MIEFTPIDIIPCNVNIQAATPFTEIYVINAKFKRIERGLGESHTRLDSGTYTFRFQEGDVIRDLSVYIDTDREVVDPLLDKQQRELEKARGNPLPYKREFSVVECLNGVKFGVEVPDVEDEPVAVTNFRVLLTDVATLDNEIDMLMGDNDSPVFAHDIELLALTFTFSDEEFRLPIIKHAMWETIVEGQSGKGIESLAISLIDDENKEAPILNNYARDDHYLKLSRIAMHALTNKRSIVSKNALLFLTNSKWLLPWHGLLALHLQIQKPEPNYSLINIMLNNLEQIYENIHHPDLLSIRWWLWLQNDDSPSPPAVRFPPTLSCSWKLLLMAHARHMDRVFSPLFSNEYESRMRIKGPWLFHCNLESVEQQQQVFKSIIKQTICEHLLGSKTLQNQVKHSEEEGKMTLSRSVLYGLDTFQTKFSPYSYSVTSLALQVFPPSKEPEEKEKFPLEELEELFNILESTELREKLVLATAHSIFYLLKPAFFKRSVASR